MNYYTKILVCLSFFSSTCFAQGIHIFYTKQSFREAQYIANRIMQHYQVPSSLIHLQQRKKPCRKKRQLNSAAQLCIENHTKKLRLMSHNPKILRDAYQVFRLP